MSEPTPLWTGDQVMAYAMTITNDPGKRALVRRVALELVHQYEAERAKDKQRIQELEAELARLRELVQWQPVEDGIYETQHAGDQVEVSGEWLTVREKDILDPTDSFIADVALPDGIRLCLRNPHAQPQPASVPDEVREALAEYAHEAWSGWMRYLFSKGEYGWADGSVEANRLPERVWMMPAWAVQRWTRQMQTPYSQLPEEEKDSDRKEADRMLEIVRRWLDAQPKEGNNHE